MNNFSYDLPSWKVVHFSNEDQALRNLAKEFADKYVKPLEREIDLSDEIPRELWKTAASDPYRFIGAIIPKEYGGRGASLFECAILMEELAYYSFSVATCVETTTIVPLYIMNSGTELLKRKYLPKMANFDMWVGIMLTDTNGGSDPAHMTTTAVRDGDEYILNGRKKLVSMAEIGDAFVVTAKTAKGAKRSVSAFIVDQHTPGMRLDTKQSCFGMHGHQTWEVVFENCRIPISQRLGDEGYGMKYALQTLDHSRATLACGYLGVARRALDEAVKFAEKRKTFGQNLIANQGLHFPLVDCYSQLEAARLLAYKACVMGDQGLWNKKETSMAKFLAAELAVKATNLAITTAGGDGTTDEYEIERLVRDAQTFQFAQGAPNTQRIVVAEQLFGVKPGQKFNEELEQKLQSDPTI